MGGVYFSQTSVFYFFAWELAAQVGIIRVSIIAKCPHGET